MLAHASKYKEIKPCVKKYLYTHVKSQFMPIHANEWPVAIFLPVEQFQKADNSTVWSDSKRGLK
jgi:hypothetical protein